MPGEEKKEESKPESEPASPPPSPENEIRTLSMNPPKENTTEEGE
jgi:hypothetical protein